MRERQKQKTEVSEPVAKRRSRPKPRYMAKGKIWVEKEGKTYMGWGRVELLERISRFGSIAAAARSMGMSYRNAWLEVEEMNRLAPAPLVEKTTGGIGGGHARITDEGQKIISEYKELRTKFQEFIKRFI